MADEASPQDNVDRLLAHLPEDSLAAHLVQEHRKSDVPSAAIKAAIAERLNEVRTILDGAAD